MKINISIARMKFLFLIFLTIFFILGGILSNKSSLAEWLASLMVYSIGGHWIYAYLWKIDMHNHLGKIPYDLSGKYEKVRFFSLIFGVCVCIFIVFI